MTPKQKQDQQSYMDSYMYEAFLRRAHQSDRNFERGIDNSVFLLLNHIDNGYYGKTKDHPKQVLKIKNYLAKAVGKVQRWKLNATEQQQVIYYANQAEQAYDEGGLAKAIRGLLDATQRFND